MRPHTLGTAIHERPTPGAPAPSSESADSREAAAGATAGWALADTDPIAHNRDNKTDAIALALGKREPILCMAVSDAKKGTRQKWNCTQGTASFAD